jgi:putative ABC transport system permease protein
VEQRRREIGVRIALGAPVRAVLANVVMEGVRIVAAGSAAGAAGAAAAARLAERQLYGVSAFDPVSFVLAVVVLSGAGLAACLIPAWTAARVDPMKVLNTQ